MRHMLRNHVVLTVVGIGLLAGGVWAQTTAPTTLPADVIMLRDQVTEAYGKLKSLTVTGSITADIDIAGQQQKKSQSFTASYLAPAQYRHAVAEELLLGSTGQKVYAYEPKTKTYVQSDAPIQRGQINLIPAPVPQILDMQNPSLLLAIADNTMSDLLDGAKRVELGSAEKVGQTDCSKLTFVAGDGRQMTLLIDTQTHLLRQIRFDLADVFIQRGAPDVKSALLTVDYTQVTANAPVDAAQFAWTPPEGAKEQTMGRPMADTSALENQAAPDFKLKGLDGKEVQLASLKGSVVVLDFWATWCGPCVRSLPDLNKLYDQRRDKNLKVFAVNQQEDLPTVQAFVTQKKLTLPVLLDGDGVVGEAYAVRAIPQTVVIGKDGKVRKVFIGIPPGGEADIAKAVDAAMEAK